MSGILGIWNLDGGPVDRDLLIRLNSRLAHRGPDGASAWVEGPAGLGYQMFRITPESMQETQPWCAPSGEAIVFDGRLDNRDELAGLLGRAFSESTDCSLVMAAYLRYGDAVAEHLTGDFAFGIWDPGRRRMLLARDAMGMRPLYYRWGNRCFLFASEIKPILAHPEVRTRPNEEALADWMLKLPGEDTRGLTFFDGVYSVPPAHQAEVSDSGITLRQYWDFDKTRRIQFSTQGEYVEAFREHFDRAIRRRLSSAHPVTVSLSAGLDSSSIYCWAETLRRTNLATTRLQAVHHQYPRGSKADAEVFLGEIERMYGVSVRRIPAVLRGPTEGVEEQIRRVEAPFLTTQWSTDEAYFDGVKDTGARLLLHGIFADEFLASDVYAVDYFLEGRWGKLWRFAERNPARFRNYFLRNLGSYLLPRGVTRWVRRFQPGQSAKYSDDLLTDSFCRRIQERDWRWSGFPGPFASAHASYIYRRARSRYLTFLREAEDRILAHHQLVWALPYVDRDLVGFLMAIPGEVIGPRESMKMLLRTAMKEVLPPAIMERHSRTGLGEILNPIFRSDFERQLLQRRTDSGTLRPTGYIVPAWLSRAKERDLKAMQGHSVGMARRYCDLLALETWLRIFC